MPFATPVDIANRALQYCGVQLLDADLGFAEQSDRAEQTNFAYSMLRRTELQRNDWRFAIRTAVIRPVNTDPTQNPTLQLNPSLWSSAIPYALGALVTDAVGGYWVSNTAQNLNNNPLNSTFWDQYYGAACAQPYDTTGKTTYLAGDVVYTTTGNGQFVVYMSRVNSNAAVPNVVDPWSATTIYMKDSIVVQLGVNYQSLFDVNINNTPSAATAPAAWVSATTYAAGQQVTGSDGFIYTSINNGNVGNDPHLTMGFWTNTGVLAAWTTALTRTASADEWLVLGVVLTQLPVLSPVGIVMNVTGAQRSFYPLPVNFLSSAPQDPKAGSVSYLGAPSGNQYLDWRYDGRWLVTRTTGPIVLRFVADITDVRQMDDMFCEGLAARVAHAIAPKLTQSVAKQNDIAAAYGKFMGEARIVNGIEQGATEPPEDDYITARL